MEFYHKDIDTVKYVLATSNRPTQLEKKFLFCLVQKICFVKEKNVKKQSNLEKSILNLTTTNGIMRIINKANISEDTFNTTKGKLYAKL